MVMFPLENDLFFSRSPLRKCNRVSSSLVRYTKHDTRASQATIIIVARRYALNGVDMQFVGGHLDESTPP